MIGEKIGQHYAVKTSACIASALLCGGSWGSIVLHGQSGEGVWLCAVLSTVLLAVTAGWQLSLYRRQSKKVLYLLDAIENGDTTLRFTEVTGSSNDRLVNKALNRVAHILYKVKSETVQREKYYELVLECVDTGIVVLNDDGAVYQKNSKALSLLGLGIFTHISQLARVDLPLSRLLAGCHAGDKLQAGICHERGTVQLSVRVSDIVIHDEHLRILALNDINSELDEKEIDSWIRLTRVLTHEIMNAVTPLTSLSDALLEKVKKEEPEMKEGLQTISNTGKGLLAFVESYRKFTRIPAPEPSLFYVKEFLDRMVELARHQYPDSGITFALEVQPPDLILHADEHLIAQVVTNLLKNAMQAIADNPTPRKEAGRIAIRAYCNEAEAVLIEITNNGPAISPDLAEHIFIPFFTTKEGGSGIGLSISRQIMRLSGGSLSLVPGEETTFVLKFN